MAISSVALLAGNVRVVKSYGNSLTASIVAWFECSSLMLKAKSDGNLLMVSKLCCLLNVYCRCEDCDQMWCMTCWREKAFGHHYDIVEKRYCPETKRRVMAVSDITNGIIRLMSKEPLP